MQQYGYDPIQIHGIPCHVLQASGEMKAQIVLSCTRHIEDRGLDSNNADCKEFILILPIGSRQVPQDNYFA